MTVLLTICAVCLWPADDCTCPPDDDAEIDNDPPCPSVACPAAPFCGCSGTRPLIAYQQPKPTDNPDPRNEDQR